MKHSELMKIIELHQLFLNGDENGKCANLSNLDLSNIT